MLGFCAYVKCACVVSCFQWYLEGLSTESLLRSKIRVEVVSGLSAEVYSWRDIVNMLQSLLLRNKNWSGCTQHMKGGLRVMVGFFYPYAIIMHNALLWLLLLIRLSARCILWLFRTSFLCFWEASVCLGKVQRNNEILLQTFSWQSGSCFQIYS